MTSVTCDMSSGTSHGIATHDDICVIEPQESRSTRVQVLEQIIHIYIHVYVYIYIYISTRVHAYSLIPTLRVLSRGGRAEGVEKLCCNALHCDAEFCNMSTTISHFLCTTPLHCLALTKTPFSEGSPSYSVLLSAHLNMLRLIAAHCQTTGQGCPVLGALASLSLSLLRARACSLSRSRSRSRSLSRARVRCLSPLFLQRPHRCFSSSLKHRKMMRVLSIRVNITP